MGAARHSKTAPEQEKANPFIAAVIAEGAEQIVEVWPENWLAYTVFVDLGTQWNVGFGSVVGLRYESLYPLLDRETDDPEDWRDLFDSVRTIESAALDAINSKQ